jgi:RES domain-containing protein
MDLDRDLVRALDRLTPRQWTGTVLRHHAPRYRALDGQGARINGGRWNPSDSFAVVYTALEPGTIDAEFGRLTRRTGLPAQAFLPRRIASIDVRLERVLDLTDTGTRRRLGVTLAQLTDDDWSRTQGIGQAAHFLGYEGVLAPGADGGTTLAVFPGSLSAGSKLTVVSEEAYPISRPSG